MILPFLMRRKLLTFKAARLIKVFFGISDGLIPNREREHLEGDREPRWAVLWDIT